MDDLASEEGIQEDVSSKLRDLLERNDERLHCDVLEGFEDEVKELEKVVNIRSEESIHQELYLQLNKLSAIETNAVDLAASSSNQSESCDINQVHTNQADLKISVIDRQVELGEITPFEADLKKKTGALDTGSTFNATTGLLDLEKYLKRQAEVAAKRKLLKPSKPSNGIKEKQSAIGKKVSKARNGQKKGKKRNSDSLSTEKSDDHQLASLATSEPSKPSRINLENSGSESEYIPSDEELSDEDHKKRPMKRKKTQAESIRKKRILDDGDEDIYRQRVEHRRSRLNPTNLRTVDNLFKVPKCIWKKLFDYQKVSIRWLWELHGRDLGGLLGDDMGLGKTVQVIAFFAGLDCSELLSDGGRFRGLGPTLIVCPATLLEQWVQHFHDWWPSLRVVTLHSSGTHRGEPEELLESLKTGGIMLTSYSGVLGHVELLVPYQWHYVVLDEGHKIRNPQAKVTKIVKKLCTPHRLLLTGSPMQNSLKELWSLFDFILPGKLGTLDAFMEHCAIPITRGGYANASSLQEATALQVATMLKDAISPYMLRRSKNDVKCYIDLPEKNEQVLFCSLTREQTDLYKGYLKSENVGTILHEKNSVLGDGRHRARLLIALTILRKICNHPDLYVYGHEDNNAGSDEDVDLGENVDLEKFGYWKKSGKMTVVRSLLRIWKSQGHRVLLFTQGRQMLYILEALLQREEYSYLRLDGTTPVTGRQKIIRKFNEDNSYLVFISTTRVGGLGINLTGADRVIIYDPDWNPATDVQARERAWRIGQDKQVTIYRLISVGTIEEKIYHRQIFKLLLSSRILEDPRQRRLFQTTDLTELLNLNEPIDGTTSESDRLFGKSNWKKNHLPAKKNNKDQESDEIKRKKRKEQKIAALFDGEEVSCLVGRRLGQSSKEDEVVDDDNYVLNKLFSKTKVSAALEHEGVLSSAKLDSNTATPMQKLARETAVESMEFVRQSRKWCWRPSFDPV